VLRQLFVRPPPQEVIEEAGEDEKVLVQWLACRHFCSGLKENDPKVWWADQITNPDNPMAHRLSTAKEILDQIDGKVNIWVASVGSTGALWGVAEALKEKNPEMKIVALHPTDSPLFEWVIQGRWNYWTKRLEFNSPQMLMERMLETGLPDEIISVEDEDARNIANRLAQEEGVFCGMSSGANVYGALELAKKLNAGDNVVTIIVDRREKYAGEHPFEHYIV
jgi:cysteine synthase A